MTDRGIYDKFTVTRTDGQSEPGGKHEGCVYFVLDVYCDLHADKALAAYAEACREKRPALALDIDKLLASIQLKRAVAPHKPNGLAGLAEVCEKLQARIESEDPQDWNDSEQRKLSGRIETFYRRLNQQDWTGCFELIDPRLRSGNDITFKTFAESMTGFFESFGPLANIAVDDVKLYCDVPNNKPDNRDFAYASATWEDREHNIHKSQERWVKADDGQWYSRKVGMLGLHRAAQEER